MDNVCNRRLFSFPCKGNSLIKVPEEMLTKAALDGGPKCTDVANDILVFREKVLNGATKGNKFSTSVKDHSSFFVFSGNTHGSNQPRGILAGKQVYLMQPLWGGDPFCFDVPASHGPMRRDGMKQ